MKRFLEVLYCRTILGGHFFVSYYLDESLRPSQCRYVMCNSCLLTRVVYQINGEQ